MNLATHTLLNSSYVGKVTKELDDRHDYREWEYVGEDFKQLAVDLCNKINQIDTPELVNTQTKEVEEIQILAVNRLDAEAKVVVRIRKPKTPTIYGYIGRGGLPEAEAIAFAEKIVREVRAAAPLPTPGLPQPSVAEVQARRLTRQAV